jgi:hypothetical protein
MFARLSKGRRHCGKGRRQFRIQNSEFPHLPPTNYLWFQQHSRFGGLSAFVFIDIPASWPSFPQRSFVFNDIPALVVRFLKLLVLSFPVGGDILSGPTMPAKSPLHPASLKCIRQSAVSSRQTAGVAQVPSRPAGDLRPFKGSLQSAESRCSSF